MKNLFQEFSEVGLDEWTEKIFADLKGKPKELLSYSPEREIDVKSYYHRTEIPKGQHPIEKPSVGWKNRRLYNAPTNERLLKALNEGIDCLGLVYADQQSFDKMTKGIQFEYIDSDVLFKDAKSAASFIGHSTSRLRFDIFADGATSGKWNHKTEEFLHFFEKQSKHQTLWVAGSIYGEAGSSTIQELAFTANHLNEYIQLLTDKGIPLREINQKMSVELSVTDDYFLNIAKFKVFRYLVTLIFSAYDANYEVSPFKLYAKTSSRHLALNDSNNNLLRQTTQAMSAIIGGCDVITIPPLQLNDSEKDGINERMTKNIPLILKEESYLDKVTDAAEGAYYVEHLCDQLQAKAWSQFNEIEKQGGYCVAIETNYIQDVIEKNKHFLIEQMNSGEKTFLGVNKFASTLESWIENQPEQSFKEVTFKALKTFRIEEHFKKEANEQSNV